MQKLRTPFLLICLASMLSLGACKDAPCEEVDCGTGQCMEGICICDSLHEGLACEIPVTDKFIGDWTFGQICNSTSEVYDCSIQEGSAEGQLILDGFGPDRLPVLGLVSKEDIRFPIQAYGQATVVGEGGFGTDSSFITIEFTVDYGGGAVRTCIGTLERQ